MKASICKEITELNARLHCSTEIGGGDFDQLER
jgi:hypothetical protein